MARSRARYNRWMVTMIASSMRRGEGSQGYLQVGDKADAAAGRGNGGELYGGGAPSQAKVLDTSKKKKDGNNTL